MAHAVAHAQVRAAVKSTIMRYPATIAGLIGLVGIVVAAALFLGNDTEGSSRFATLVGLASVAVMALANNLRTDHAANDSHETKMDVKQAVIDGAPTTKASLDALTEMLRRTESAATRVEEAAATVSNGHGDAP